MKSLGFRHLTRGEVSVRLDPSGTGVSMIINDKEASQRLNSPSNLINRLKNLDKRKDAMVLFGINKNKTIDNTPTIEKKSFNPFEHKSEEQPKDSSEKSLATLDTILTNGDAQIKLATAHDKAIELLNSSLNALQSKLDDVSAARLPSVIVAASKTVESIRKERLKAAENSKDQEVHYHFYTPEQKKISDYEVIDVVGTVEAGAQ